MTNNERIKKKNLTYTWPVFKKKKTFPGRKTHYSSWMVFSITDPVRWLQQKVMCFQGRNKRKKKKKKGALARIGTTWSQERVVPARLHKCPLSLHREYFQLRQIKLFQVHGWKRTRSFTSAEVLQGRKTSRRAPIQPGFGNGWTNAVACGPNKWPFTIHTGVPLTGAC